MAKFVVIEEHKQDGSHGAPEIVRVPDGELSCKIVEAWQRDTLAFRWGGRIPGCTHRMLEADNLVDALIEVASRRRAA